MAVIEDKKVLTEEDVKDLNELEIQLCEIDSLILYARSNISYLPLFMSLIQFIFVIGSCVISFYFLYIIPTKIDIILSILFTVLLGLIYFAYINLINTYSQFNREIRSLNKALYIRCKIFNMIELIKREEVKKYGRY